MINFLINIFLLFCFYMISSYIQYWLFFRHWVQADIYDKTIKLKKEED